MIGSRDFQRAVVLLPAGERRFVGGGGNRPARGVWQRANERFRPRVDNSAMRLSLGK